MHSFLFIIARVRFHQCLSVNKGQVHRDGVPLCRDGVPPGHGWDTPGVGQQMEYLIRSGRCASVVYAGGLSCFPRGQISSISVIYRINKFMFFSARSDLISCTHDALG